MSSIPFVITALVTVSGACSLIYQVVWERVLRYSLGGDSISAAIVSGTFLLGLGIGALVFGRWHRRAFAVYATVEAAIGLYGMTSFHVLAPLSSSLGALLATPVSAAEGLRPVVVAAAVLFLLPPCVLIGGTGPLMFNCFIRSGPYQTRSVGWLYGANTFGAALGVLATPFVLLNRFSIPVTLVIVGGVNLLLAAAIAAYGWRRQLADSTDPAGHASLPRPAAVPWPPGAWPFLLSLAFASGLIALSFEIVLLRGLFIQNPSSPYNFPAMLLPFLASLAAGSWLFTRWPDRAPRQALGRIGGLFVAAVTAMMGAVAGSAALSLAGYRALAMTEPYSVLAFLLHATLLGTSLPLFLGGVMPLLLRLAAPTGQALPRGTGVVYLVNSVGAFCGALLTQFLGFPALGTRGVLLTLFLVGLAAGGVCLWAAATRVLRWAVLAALVVLAAGPLLAPSVLWRVYAFGIVAPIADAVEGVTGVAVIDWHGGMGDLFVNGQYMSRLPDHPRHLRLVSFALFLPQRERVLLLGLGGGGMVRHLVHDPAVRRLDVVDWSRELPPLLDRPRARTALDDALRSPRVHLCRCDARVVVGLYEEGAFDVAIDNLAVAHWVGATSVKSIEYFRRLRRVVGSRGVLVYQGNWGGARKAILAGLTETFRHVFVHPGADLTEEVVLASDHDLDIDRDRVAAVLDSLGPIGTVRTPEDLFRGLARVTREDVRKTKPVRDDRLIYEYHRRPTREIKQAVRSLVAWLWR